MIASLPPVLAAGLLLLVAVPASAQSGITSPGAGEVVARDAVVPLRAVVEAPGELTLQAPDAETAEVVAVQTAPEGGELAYDLDTACVRRPCTQRSPAANGTWTLRLTGQVQDERAFVLRIPPAAPDDVAAAPSESGVLVRWRQGDEPDLTGYEVRDRRGAVVLDRIGLDFCDAERRCSVEVPEQGGAWSVRAFRSSCPGCAQVLASPSSPLVGSAGAAQQGPLPAAAAPARQSPAPAAAAPRRPDQRAAFTRAFGPGRPVQRPAPQTPAIVPRAAPQPDGSFQTELGYGQREVVVRRPAPLARVQDAVGSALGERDRVRLIALSVLLVAGSLWLRRWARRAVVD